MTVAGPELVWGLLIAVYLYLGGMSGGMWMAAFAAEYSGRDEYLPFTKTAVYLAPVLLAVGTLLLVLDLARPSREPLGLLHIMNVFNNPTSIMTLGSIIISSAIIWGLVTAVIYFANASRRVRLFFSFIAALLGFATAAYTGLLLALARDVPLWASGWLSWLFVTSGVSSGIAAAIVATRVLGELAPSYILPEFKKYRDKWAEVAEKAHSYDIKVMWMELAALVAWLLTVYIRYGPAPVTWLFTGIAGAAFAAYLVLGWALPVALYYLYPRKESWVNIYLGALLIAVLALALRYAVLTAPQLAELAAGLPIG